MERDYRPRGLAENPPTLERETFAGKIVVVTGASYPNSIGAEIAKAFARHGALAVHTVSTERGETAGDALSYELIHSGAFYSRHIIADVSDPESVAQMAETIKNGFGRVDVVVNNAGINPKEDLFHRLPADEYTRAFNVNARGAALVSGALLTLFDKTDGGVIINVSSTVGNYGNKNQAAYAMAKGALDALTKTQALEVGPRNIRVITVSPGLVANTEMTKGMSPIILRIMEEQTPHGLATAEDVARIVLELAHPESTITGQNIEVDGGLGALTPIARDAAFAAVRADLEEQVRARRAAIAAAKE